MGYIKSPYMNKWENQPPSSALPVVRYMAILAQAWCAATASAICFTWTELAPSVISSKQRLLPPQPGQRQLVEIPAAGDRLLGTLTMETHRSLWENHDFRARWKLPGHRLLVNIS